MVNFIEVVFGGVCVCFILPSGVPGKRVEGKGEVQLFQEGFAIHGK